MRPETSVLVVGGGPAGSVAATLLAREGIDVMLVEKERHPRYHIGESLLTSAIPMLEFIGLFDRVDGHGFVRKYGGYFRMKQGELPGHVDFSKLGKYKYSYQVVRSEFDAILFDHARRCGVDAHDGTAVTDIEFANHRPVAARLRQLDGGESTVRFGHIVDATGQAGLLSARYFKNRRAEEAFANVAVGGYFRGARPYRDVHGQEHPGDFSMEAHTDGGGWTWAIPLHDGRLSVGVVVHRDNYRALRQELGSHEAVFTQMLQISPDVTELIEHAMREGDIKVWRDYSYFAGSYAGSGYRLIGDAAGFIDPLFSTGVHMAFFGALSAAATIRSELRGEIPPAQLERFHHLFLDQAYTRIAIIVAAFYRQLRDQQRIVFPQIDSNTFQLAFDVIQPIVSGNLDLNLGDIPDAVIERTMDFTTDMMRAVHELETDNKAAKLMTGSGFDLFLRMSGRLAAVEGLYIRMKQGQLGVVRLSRAENAAMGVGRHAIRRLVSYTS